MEMENTQASKRSRLSNSGYKDDEKALAMVLSHPSSRIFRVSRTSGGKDRHSKVFTSRGLRDRRVRLSVSTAIQFYDLQDRLGYDQPSKAIEWLIKAASSAISELPSLASSFVELAETSRLNTEAEPGWSSTSETSKGSVLSLSRSEIRIKARERARHRAAKDKKEKREEAGGHLATAEQHPQDVNQSSFTELLNATPVGASEQIQHIFPTTAVTADYFGQADLFARTHQLPSFCSHKGQNFSGSTSLGTAAYNIATGDNPDMQHFAYMNDHLDDNLNFSIAPGLAAHRGTLQSNPSAHLAFYPSSSSSSIDVPNFPFVFGAAAAPSVEAHFHSVFDSRLQFSREPITPFCLDGYKSSDHKEKRKS